MSTTSSGPRFIANEKGDVCIDTHANKPRDAPPPFTTPPRRPETAQGVRMNSGRPRRSDAPENPFAPRQEPFVNSFDGHPIPPYGQPGVQMYPGPPPFHPQPKQARPPFDPEGAWGNAARFRDNPPPVPADDAWARRAPLDDNDWDRERWARDCRWSVEDCRQYCGCRWTRHASVPFAAPRPPPSAFSSSVPRPDIPPPPHPHPMAGDPVYTAYPRPYPRAGSSFTDPPREPAPYGAPYAPSAFSVEPAPAPPPPPPRDWGFAAGRPSLAIPRRADPPFRGGGPYTAAAAYEVELQREMALEHELLRRERDRERERELALWRTYRETQNHADEFENFMRWKQFMAGPNSSPGGYYR
jgi:hypothetical protein